MAAQFSISVLISAIDKITSPLAHIGEKVARFGREATRGIGDLGNKLVSAKSLIIGAAAALGAEKAWEGFRQWAEGADSLNELAFRLGMTTQALQEYQFAAQLTGVTTEDFNNSIEIMSKLMGQARMHSGKLYNDLSKHAPGLMKQVLATHSNAEALDVMMKALDQTSDASERAALATTFFGRGGMVMATMLKDGYSGLQKLRAEAASYGLVTTETGEAADDFNDGLTRMKYAIEGVKNAIGRDLLPVLKPYLDMTIEWIKSHRDLIALKVKDFIEAVHDRLVAMGAWLDDHGDDLWLAFKGGVEVIGAVAGGVKTLIETLGGVGTAITVAAGAFAVAAFTNPSLAALLVTLTAVISALAAIDSWQQKRMDEEIQRNHPGVPVLRKKSELDRWVDEHDPAKASERAAKKAGEEAMVRGTSDAPVPENVLTESRLDEIVKTVVHERETRGFSFEGASGGQFSIPISLSLDDSKLPDWLRAKTQKEGNQAADVGVRRMAPSMAGRH
jgi:hypothetical protein